MLLDACAGNLDVIDRLLPLVYDELRRLAHRHLRRERADHTLDTTGLVHEVYLQLVDQTSVEWRDRAQFFAFASKAMRHFLIDYARRKNAQKRGGRRRRVELEAHMLPVEEQVAELLALDDALTDLAAHDARMARVVECRYFGGMTMKDTAEALGVSKRTAERDWTRAKAYLYRALNR